MPQYTRHMRNAKCEMKWVSSKKNTTNMSQPEQHCGDAADDDDDIIIAAIDNTDEPRNQRHQWLQTCDRDLLAWFCTKYAKETFLSYFSNGRSSVVCLYQQYKTNLKNLGKRHFDCKSANESAVQNFFSWCILNDADIYLRDNHHMLTSQHADHKRRLYARYKQPMSGPTRHSGGGADVPRGKQRLMARDAVFYIKNKLAM